MKILTLPAEKKLSECRGGSTDERAEDSSSGNGVKEEQGDEEEKPITLELQEKERLIRENVRQDARSIKRRNWHQIKKCQEEIDEHDDSHKRRETRPLREELKRETEDRRRHDVCQRSGKRGKQYIPAWHAKISRVNGNGLTPSEAGEEKKQRPPQREVLERIQRHPSGIRGGRVPEGVCGAGVGVLVHRYRHE